MHNVARRSQPAPDATLCMLAASLRAVLEEVVPLVVAPLLVGAATPAARRWDHRVAGLVGAFPAIVGPGC